MCRTWGGRVLRIDSLLEWGESRSAVKGVLHCTSAVHRVGCTALYLHCTAGWWASGTRSRSFRRRAHGALCCRRRSCRRSRRWCCGAEGRPGRGGWRSNIEIDGEGWMWSTSMLKYGELGGSVTAYRPPQRQKCGTRRMSHAVRLKGRGKRQRPGCDPPWD